MAYQLFPSKDTQRIQNGDFVKLQLTQTAPGVKTKDSVYFTTAGRLPQYQQISGNEMPYDISELWTSLHLGDSIVATQLIDTFMKKNPQAIPAHFKKGDKIMTYMKVIAIFKNDSLAKADYEKTTKDWGLKETKQIEDYLAEKKITAQRTPSGAFVEILTPGSGNLIDSGNYVSVNYTGTSWSGKKFDSNVDPAFGHLQPLSFVVGSTGPNSMIKGFDEGVRFMRPGSKAKVYIPSTLAYGGNPQSPNIKPFENLIFEIEITDVKDKAPAAPTNAPKMSAEDVQLPQQ